MVVRICEGIAQVSRRGTKAQAGENDGAFLRERASFRRGGRRRQLDARIGRRQVDARVG